MENISAVIEALILSSESPLALEKICAVLDGVDKTEVKDALDKLIAGYEERQSGISVQEVAGGFQFRTRPDLCRLGEETQRHKACVTVSGGAGNAGHCGLPATDCESGN